MLARLFPGVVIAGRNRTAGVHLAQEQFGLDIAILDDGFQHRRLNRSVDLLLLNARQGPQECRLLPAGPFREPFSAAREPILSLSPKAMSKQVNFLFHKNGAIGVHRNRFMEAAFSQSHW